MKTKETSALKLGAFDSVKTVKSARKLIYSIFRFATLLSIGYIIIYPLFYMIVTSLQSKDAFLNSSRVWIPSDFDIVYNFKTAAHCLNYGKSILSTLKNEIIAAVLQIASCAVAAYGFARFDFKLKKPLMAILFLTILVPDMILLIPRMVNFSKLDLFGIFGLLNKLTGIDLRLNLIDSVGVFWIPALLGVGLRSGILIFIYIQFFKGLPHELEEAAWVDGAGPIRTFCSIALPSSGVVILTVTVFSMIWHWNDTVLSEMYLSQDYPLAVMLRLLPKNLPPLTGLYVSQNTPQSMAVLMAACVLFVFSMLIIYLIIQRWFIESIDRVAITG